MINFDTIGIPMAFTLLGIMALWLIIGSKGWWWLKGIFILFSLYFSFAVLYSVDNLLGWPSESELPTTFRIYWAEVKEPNKISGEEGAVYLWVREIKLEEDEDGVQSFKEPFYDQVLIDFYPKVKNEPRIHKLPYSKMSREQIQKLKQAIAKGRKFYGKRGEGGFEGKAEGEGEGDGDGDAMGRRGQKGYHYEIPGDIKFYELPPPKLPEKD